MAQSLMEKIMAEGKGNYENESNELNIRQALIDGSGRFARHLGTFSENFTGSYFKIGQTLQGRDSRSRIENGMQQGIEGTASEVLQVIFGVDADFIAHRMHMVAGQGVDGDVDMSLELGNGIDLENAYYDKVSGAIYATVAKGNGCEGNLVVIPVETFTQTITQAPKSSGTSNSFQQELIPVDPSISDFPEIEVDCNGEILKAEYVTSYEGYQVYIAAGKVFRVIDGGLESRNFGLNEGMAWKGMTAENVKDNIGDIMKNGTISILGLFKLADHWEFVGTTQNVCTVPIEGDGGGGKGPGSENDSSTPGHGGASDNGGGGSNGDGSGGRS